MLNGQIKKCHSMLEVHYFMELIMYIFYNIYIANGF